MIGLQDQSELKVHAATEDTAYDEFAKRYHAPYQHFPPDHEPGAGFVSKWVIIDSLQNDLTASKFLRAAQKLLTGA